MLGLVVAVGVVWSRQGPQRADLSPPGPTRAAFDRADAATVLVERLQRALRTGNGLPALVEPGNRAALRELRAVTANIAALRIDHLALRYVDEAGVGAPSTVPAAARPWVAIAQLSWRLKGVDRADSQVEVPLVLGRQADRAVFETARFPSDRRVPVWFTNRVAVRRSSDALVLTARRSRVGVLASQARSAVRTVRAVLPRWDRPLVVEEPATGRGFETTAGMSPADARAIAAVTTTTDGTGLPRTPVRTYVNPRVYDPLGPTGQQIVLSHEAAHQALGAATTSLPLWLSEGTADYIALADSSVPVPTLAAQIRRLVRRDGVPARLPGQAQFSGANPDIGAYYEAAWLAVRLLAQQHGPAALLRFYRASERAGGTQRTFRTVLGTTQARFVRRWRAYLTSLAG